MSYRSGTYYEHYDSPPARPVRARAQAPAVHRHAAAARDYILGHAGRQVRLGPIAFWIVVGTLVIMAVWTVATATYFAFREDVLTRLIGRQAEMQFAYEDRVADLRAQIDRVTSRQLLDQEQFEQKLEQLIRRQAALEQRAATLSSALADPSSTGSIKLPGRNSDAASPPKPSPISDKGAWLNPRDRNALKGATLEATLVRVQTSLDRVEIRQGAILASVEESYDAKARRIRGVLAELGFNAGKAASGTGGPFVPVKPRSDVAGFEQQLHRINFARAQIDQLNRALGTVPVRKPLAGDMDTSSGFGMRMDPFINSPAMHTGLDFRGSMGDPVRATAAGKVTQASWNGGYGKMVEIDHGNGLSTRYGHLSQIDAHVGQNIRTGQIIGRLGSTGRSTGPHLHYETRIDGEAVDPQKFLRAGARLGSL